MDIGLVWEELGISLVVFDMVRWYGRDSCGQKISSEGGDSILVESSRVENVLSFRYGSGYNGDWISIIVYS